MAGGKTSKTYQLCIMALMAAVMCVLGPMSIPIGAVPISFTNLVIYLTAYILGMKLGTISYIIYLLLGLAGLPVFSGYTGGLAKLAGPTGGYLIGFILTAALCGFVMEKSNYKTPWCVVGMVLGLIAAYAFGTVWFVYLMDCTLGYALAVCVQPFLIGDAVKMVFAAVLGSEVRKRLKMADLLVVKTRS